jgi:hypothetical protein
MSPEKIWSIAETVPPEWYGGDTAALERLVEQLLTRRGRVRELIVEFRESYRAPFPKWVRVGEKVGGQEFPRAGWAEDMGSGLVM